ncbi:ApeA N-terminal domain 1-containing protein [Zhihengliuella sp. ISTPL4]|uniref:ApeA N-terminal domain 1-containing protein n=1 Tax=Zhihengliuella sp. ISTPL4 TaxID=2058657 RepID=UPI001305268C|nr:hypothetical protein [Zhihengliuella sp. ISTPL4]
MGEVSAGTPRLGVMVDGSGSDEAPVAMFLDNGSSLELTLVVDPAVRLSERYERWWGRSVMHMDDPDRTRRSYEPPRSLGFRDSYGTLVLVGCRSTDSRTTGGGSGHGKLVANFAVVDGQWLDYEQINGLRTDAPGVAAWTRLSGIRVDVQRDDRRRARSVRMDLESPADIRLAGAMNLGMHLHWRTDNPRGRFSAEEVVQLQTLVRDRRTWDDHLDLHGAVLDLAAISAWEPFGFNSIEVQIDNDRVRTGEDTYSDPQWRKVATHRLVKHEAWKEGPRFLFPFADVGPRGIKRWLRIRRDYKQVIDAMARVLYSDEPWGISSVVHSGIAFEALGYMIDLRKNDGAHLNGRKQMNFKPGLRVILADMELVPLDDAEGWIERSYAAYMGSKHVDRAMPDSLDLLNTLRENLLVLRFWIGLKIGVPAATLENLLQRDQLSSQFIALD